MKQTFESAVPTLPPAAEDGGARHRLLLAATELFGARGFEATSVRDLAEHAGVNIAAVNYHFGSKEELRIEAMRFAFARAVPAAAKMQAVLHAARQSNSIKSAESALREFIQIFMLDMLGTQCRDWSMFQRERMATTPSPAFMVAIDEFFRPIGTILDGILILLLPRSDRQQRTRSATSIIGQCVHTHGSITTVRHLAPIESDTRQYFAAMADHIAKFSILALRGLRNEAAAAHKLNS